MRKLRVPDTISFRDLYKIVAIRDERPYHAPCPCEFCDEARERIMPELAVMARAEQMLTCVEADVRSYGHEYRENFYERVQSESLVVTAPTLLLSNPVKRSGIWSLLAKTQQSLVRLKQWLLRKKPHG